MKPEAQWIAISEACGYMIHHYISDGDLHGWQEKCGSLLVIPKYLTDLNAMHEAEKVLTDDQWYGYVAHLTHDIPTSYSYVRATAAQRAEAFLRTLNLWKYE